LNYYERNLGMFMMTSAVAHFAELGYQHLYLGSCYSRNALYKTQFSGAEFFNGFKWSNNLQELKYLIQRDSQSVSKHLLETEEFVEKFYADDVAVLAHESLFTS
jgi:arginyl-tRNA--protein-N-Asp/Glu arginylyltransferase